MPDTKVSVTVNGSPLSASDLIRVQSVHIEQTNGARDMVSVVASLLTDNHSNWSSPLDPLAAAPAVPFRVTLRRGSDALTVEGYSGSAAWQISAGGQSTLSVSGMDAGVLLDRVEQTAPQQGTDSEVARAIFARNRIATVMIGSTTSSESSFTPQQRATDWAFLRTLARRNDFDVWIEFEGDQPLWHFDRIDATASPQATLDLAFGTLGGTPSATVDLLAGRTVQVRRVVPGTTTVDEASDDGNSGAMGPRSLGGWATVRADRHDVAGSQDAATSARSLATASAFAATLTVSLNSASMPLLRARRTVTVTGVGPVLSGLWLVQAVSHTVTHGSHTQSVTLVRNALGTASGSSGALAGLAAAVGL
jgi:phage protein D